MTQRFIKSNAEDFILFLRIFLSNMCVCLPITLFKTESWIFSCKGKHKVLPIVIIIPLLGVDTLKKSMRVTSDTFSYHGMPPKTQLISFPNWKLSRSKFIEVSVVIVQLLHPVEATCVRKPDGGAHRVGKKNHELIIFFFDIRCQTSRTCEAKMVQFNLVVKLNCLGN